MFYVFFGLSVCLLLILLFAAAYRIFQTRKKENLTEIPKIHQSGAFSIVRQPAPKLKEHKIISENDVQRSFDHSGIQYNTQLIQQYMEHWNSQTNINISVIDDADRRGIQTFKYEIPSKEAHLCPQISNESYITREQIQNYPELVPPFYLGCEIKLKIKEPWDTNLNGMGWKPMLPDKKGSYITPQRSLIVPLS